MFGSLFTRSNTQSNDNTGSVRDFDAIGAHRLIGEGAVLIDVRTAQETAGGVIRGAHTIPLSDIGARLGEVLRLAGNDKAKPIVVYCRSGNRSGSAKSILERAGFTHVVNAGGYDSLR